MLYDSILKIDYLCAFSLLNICIFSIFVAYLFCIVTRTNQSVKQRTYSFFSFLASACLGSFLLLHSGSAQALDIGAPVVSPAALTVNASTNVFVSAIMNDPNVINANVQLIKDGKISVIGSLNDTGLDGDALAKDGIFSGQVQIQAGAVGHVDLRVSAALKGVLKRTVSPAVTIDVLPVGAPLSSVVPDLENFSFYPGTGEKIIADEVVACFNPSVDYEEVVSIGATIQGTIIGRFSEIGNCYQFQLPSGSDGSNVSDAVTNLLANPNVILATPDRFRGLAESCLVPTCTDSFSSYNNQLQLAAVHDNFGKGKGVRIGIIDTGVSLDPLTGIGLAPWIIGPDFTFPGPWLPGTAIDDHGHGTNVASIARAAAPESQLYISKAFSSVRGGTASTTVNALIDASVNGVKVVNISLEDSNFDPIEYLTIQKLLINSIVVVGAAGNHSTSSPWFPGGYSGVLTVGNVDHKDVIAPDSNHGSHVEVAAPGQNIYGYGIGGGSSSMNGTSQATPFVTGVVALIKAKYPSIDPVQQILKTALPIPAAIGSDVCPNQPCNQDLGSGRLAPLGALGALRIKRNTAINAGSIQSTQITILSGSSQVYQTTIQTSGQSQGCQNINNKNPTCIVDVPFDFSTLSAGKHKIWLKTLESSASFFGSLQLNAPGVTFDSVESGTGSIDPTDNQRASCSLFGFSTKSTTFVINKK